MANNSDQAWYAVSSDDKAAFDRAIAAATERAQQAVLEAVAAHRRHGRPVYFVDAAGRLVKELPDGRRLEIQLDKNDREIEIAELAPAA